MWGAQGFHVRERVSIYLIPFKHVRVRENQVRIT
jgi:hypothetical protein